MHGFAVNLAPKLSHFSGIVPCGIADFPVTSLDEMGVTDVQTRFDLALQSGLEDFLFSLEGEPGRLESPLPFRIVCTTDLGKKWGPTRPNHQSRETF